MFAVNQLFKKNFNRKSCVFNNLECIGDIFTLEQGYTHLARYRSERPIGNVWENLAKIQIAVNFGLIWKKWVNRGTERCRTANLGGVINLSHVVYDTISMTITFIFTDGLL